MRLLLLAAVASLSFACATTSAANGPSGAGAASESDPVVARYGNNVIRQSEVDAKATDDVFKLKQQLYELRQETAEQIFVERAITEAAKKEGVSEDDWVKARLSKGLHKPTEQEMREVFDQAKERLGPDADFDAVKGQIEAFLTREQRSQKARELFDELKLQHGYQAVLVGPARPRKEVEAKGPSRGPADAKVTIVEFADFQCPFCSRSAKTVADVLAAYPKQVRLVFRHFPLSFHEHAPKAAEAANCAGEQGHFWEFHDLLYAHQDALGVDDLKADAKTMGLDTQKFDECLDSGRMKAAVDADAAAGEKLGVKGTPAFFINGVELSGAQPVDEFKKIIDAELAKAP